MSTQTRRRHLHVNIVGTAMGRNKEVCRDCGAERSKAYQRWMLHDKPVPWCEDRKLAPDSS